MTTISITNQDGTYIVRYGEQTFDWFATDNCDLETIFDAVSIHLAHDIENEH